MSCDNRKFFEEVSAYWEEQEKALAYLESHNLPSIIEDIMNYVATTKMKFPISAIREKINKFIDEPRLSQITLQKYYDSEFLPNFSINIFTKLEDDEKMSQSLKNGMFCYVENSLMAENRFCKEENINSLLEVIEASLIPPINEKLLDYKLTQQSEIDESLLIVAKDFQAKNQLVETVSKSSSFINSEESKKNKKQEKPGKASPKKRAQTNSPPLTSTANYTKSSISMILAVSEAICSAAAKTREMNNFEYLRETYEIKSTKEAKILLVLFENIPSGKYRFVDEIGLALDSELFRQNIEKFKEIFEYCYNSLFSKPNVLATKYGQRGGLLVSIDKIDQISDMINEACLKKELDFTPNIYMSFHSNFLYDKNCERYEAQPGTYKTNEEYISLLKEIEANTSVSCLMNPLSQDDDEGWNKLLEAIGENTFAFKNFDLSRFDDSAYVESFKEAGTKIIPIFNYCGPNVISSYVAAHNSLAGATTMFSTPFGDSVGCFPIDLAIAVGFDFIKVNVNSHGRSDYVDHLCRHFS